MLCITRKRGQRILIGDNITITIHRIGRNQVCIGFDAPKEVPIVRGELRDGCVPREGQGLKEGRVGTDALLKTAEAA